MTQDQKRLEQAFDIVVTFAEVYASEIIKGCGISRDDEGWLIAVYVGSRSEAYEMIPSTINHVRIQLVEIDGGA